jgi:hypothetical protein
MVFAHAAARVQRPRNPCFFKALARSAQPGSLVRRRARSPTSRR